MEDCHCIPFHHLPPVTQEPLEFPSYGSGSVKAQTLFEEVDKMLAKGALEEIEDLVQKMLVGWHPVINFLYLNLLSVTPGIRGRFRTVTTSGRLGHFSSITIFSFFFFSGHYTDDSFYANICFFLRFDYVLVVNC